MVRLINERDDMHHKYTVVNRIEMEVDSEATLDEMLTAYREFLLACGYQVNGELAVVDDDNL
jgi:hypothetical protein